MAANEWHLDYTYDRASNRLGRYDRLPGYALNNPSNEYTYDGLDRLTIAKKGSGVRGGFTPVAGAEKWVLDALGNWVERRTDLDNDDNFNESGELMESREHNAANELGLRKRGGTLETPFHYDQAGNLKRVDVEDDTDPAEVYEHDAWNRLVRVKE